MRPKRLLLTILSYAAVLPIALLHLLGELLRDGAAYLIGRKRGIEWPEPSAATRL